MAFFQDTRPSREPFLNAPPTVLWLIGVMVLAHVVRITIPEQLSHDIIRDYALIPARYAGAFGESGFGPAALLAQIVPFVSYTFLHADFGHVGINSLWLLAFGPSVARRLGTPRFLGYFFLCGVGAALAHLAANWGSPMPVIGASGAVAGLMAAGIRILYGTRRRVFDPAAGLAPILSRRVMVFTAIWVVVNTVVGVTGLGLGEGVTLIAWVAHLGGYFTGLFTIGLFDRRRAAAVSVI
jgi:membrane associated rhomboid family serine protease